MTEAEKHIFDQVEAYLNGSLDGEAKATFEANIKANPALQEQIYQHMAARKQLELTGRLQLKKQLDGLFDEASLAYVSRNRQRLWLYRIAGVVLLLGGMAVAYWMLKGNTQINYKELYAEHFEPIPVSFARDSSEPLDSSYQANLRMYESGDYERSLAFFAEIHNSTSAKNINAVENDLYYATALMQTGNAAKAIDILSSHLAHPAYADQVQWYLALAYLKLEDHSKTSELLRKISEMETHYKREAASEMLEAWPKD